MLKKRVKLRRSSKRPFKRATLRRQLEKNLPGILILIAAIIVLCLAGYALYRLVFAPLYGIMADPESAKAWIAQFGLRGYLVFILIIFMQMIIAFIPGEPLEIVAGLAFGPFLGTFLCLVGITLGSVTTFMLTRIFGVRLLQRLFSEKALSQLDLNYKPETLQRAIFLLFVIPGTPKDLMAYAAGLTPLPLKNWIVITMIARLPSIVTSTFGGHALSTHQYGTAAMIFIIGTLFSVVVYVVYERFKRER